jgi:SNF2 family DNA or RNA helicase
MTPEADLAYKSAFNTFRARWRGRVERNEIISSNEKLVIFTQLRHAASWAKLHAAEQMAEELNENNTQAVFFTAFTDTADAFTDRLNTFPNWESDKFAMVGKITGDVSQKERQRVIDGFQAGQVRFIVATFGSGGIGITLHSSHHVILIDRAWTPGDCTQAEDRLHRIGQKNTVLVDWLQVNSTDQSIDNLLLKKQHNISTILTGNTSELPLDFDIRNNVDDIFNEIFK